MGNFDNFSMEICGCSCVKKCLGIMKQAMKKIIDVFQSGTAKSDTAKSADFQSKSVACKCENNYLLSLLPYGEREGKLVRNWYQTVEQTFIFQIKHGFGILTDEGADFIRNHQTLQCQTFSKKITFQQ